MTNGMTARYASAAEIEAWDDLVAQNPAGGDFVQTLPYAAVKAAVGWTPRHLVFERGGERVSVALVLERRIPLLGRYWYLPRGPVVDTIEATREHTEALLAYVRAHEPKVFGLTIEPPILRDPEMVRTLSAALGEFGGRWRLGIQSNVSTALVNIDGDDAALLARFQKRCRNSISRAIRDGVDVCEYPSNAATFAQMHRLMKLVGGGGQTLRLRSEDYAERFWREFSEAGLGRFYGIDAGGEPAMLAYVIRVGDRAFYKDGGSDRPRTTPGMSNLLQWRMMREMRDAGAKSYDMMGTPSRERLNDPSSPNYTLAAFKLSFSGDITEYAGAFDFALRRRQFGLWISYGLPIAQRLHRRRYRDLDLY